nr:MAG TPA: hypothetical protein [Herelleviridae sp.]
MWDRTCENERELVGRLPFVLYSVSRWESLCHWGDVGPHMRERTGAGGTAPVRALFGVTLGVVVSR